MDLPIQLGAIDALQPRRMKLAAQDLLLISELGHLSASETVICEKLDLWNYNLAH